MDVVMLNDALFSIGTSTQDLSAWTIMRGAVSVQSQPVPQNGLWYASASVLARLDGTTLTVGVALWLATAGMRAASSARAMMTRRFMIGSGGRPGSGRWCAR